MFLFFLLRWRDDEASLQHDGSHLVGHGAISAVEVGRHHNAGEGAVDSGDAEGNEAELVHGEVSLWVGQGLLRDDLVLSALGVGEPRQVGTGQWERCDGVRRVLEVGQAGALLHLQCGDRVVDGDVAADEDRVELLVLRASAVDDGTSALGPVVSLLNIVQQSADVAGHRGKGGHGGSDRRLRGRGRGLRGRHRRTGRRELGRGRLGDAGLARGLACGAAGSYRYDGGRGDDDGAE